MAEPLMPCPFCGGGAADHKLNGHAPDCYLMVRFSAGMRPDAEVAAAWNRRAPDAAALREAEARGNEEAKRLRNLLSWVETVCDPETDTSDAEARRDALRLAKLRDATALRAAAAKEG